MVSDNEGSALDNITNIGDEPIKLYAIYGPPDHRHGAVHPVQADAKSDPHEA